MLRRTKCTESKDPNHKSYHSGTVSTTAEVHKSESSNLFHSVQSKIMKTVILQLLSLSSVFAIGNAQNLTCGADTLAVNDQCLCDTAACLNTTGTDVTELLDENVVYLAGIFDVANYGWGSTIFNFTVSLLNDKTDGWHDDVLLDTEIRYSIGDAACDADKAVAAYWNLRPMHAVVGCRCSGASAAVARIAGLEGVPQISPVSTSSKLDNYPLFSRTVAPDDERGEVGAVRSMLQAFGWNRVHILSTDTPFAKDIATDFRKLWQGEIASSATFTFTANGDIDPVSVAAVLSSIPVNDSRIILLAAHDQHSYPIIRQALEMGFQPDTVWVGMSWPGARMPSDTSWIPPIPGFIGLIPFRNRNSVYQDYIQRLQAAQAADGVEVWTEFDHYAVGYMVDSILAMATALGEVPVDQRRNGTLVTSTLRSLTLNGVSGELSFTDSGHRQDPRFTVSNMQKDADGNFRWVTIGSTGTEAGSTELYLNQTCFAEAGCGLKEAPSDTYPVPIEPVVDLWVAIVIPIIALLLVAVIIKYWRSHKKKVALKNTMSDMQKKMEEMKVIDDELLGIDDQVERAKLRKDSLILKRSALQDKPDHWCVSDKTLVEVEPNDDQYWDVTDRLQDTMSDAHVSKLWRIQNKSLWSYYSFHKDRLSMNGIDHNEQSVWHGTSNLDPAAIYNDRQDGFMMQFSSDGFWG